MRTMASSPANLKRNASATAEYITKIVKHNFRAPPVSPCDGQKKIWTKTKDLMIKERSEDLWEKHYIRRGNNMSRGYHSVPWEKYKHLGEEVELDTQSLVLNTMSKCLDKKVFAHSSKDEYRQERRLKTLPPIGLAAKKEMAAQPSSSSCVTKLENMKSSCYDYFRDHINEYRKVITNVKAGQPYEEYVRHKQEMQSTQTVEGECDNDMVLMSLTNLHLGLPDVQMRKDNSDDEDDTDDEKEVKTDTTSHGTKRNSYFEPVKEKHLVIGMGGRRMTIVVDNRPLTLREDRQLSAMSDLAEESTSDKITNLICCPSGITMKKERIKRDHLQYLEAILTLLTSLQNMKPKDIKSKNPLSFDAVKALRKEHTPPSSNFCGGRDSKLGSHHVTPRWQVKSRKISSTTGIESADLEQQLQKGTLEQISNLSGNVTSVAARMRRKSIWPASQKIGYDHQVVETWEDLINLEDKKPNFAIQSKIIMKALLWSRRKAITLPLNSSSSTVQETADSHRSVAPRIRKDLLSADGHRQQVHTSVMKKMPIWQMVALDKPMRKETSRSSRDPLNLVQHNKKAFNKVKQDLRQDMELEFQKQDREKLAVFKLKYGAFENMSPVFEEHMSRLKMSTKNITRNVDICDVKPSKWYEELEEKTYSITGPFDKDINHVLRQIGRFSTMDSKTITFAKAKLCLLVMSLPAYEILTIPTQRGIKYVMEVVLLGDTSQLEEWFNHRKIHLVVKSDNSAQRNGPSKE